MLVTKELVIVIAEGGPKSQKKFKRLMLNRIKWDEDTAQGRRQDKIDKKKFEVNIDKQMNKCQLVWEVCNLPLFAVSASQISNFILF